MQTTIAARDLTPSMMRGMKLKDLNTALHELLGDEAIMARSKDDAIHWITTARRAEARAHPRSEGTIREHAEKLLSTTKLRYSEVLERVKARFPNAHTSRSSLRWYASQMRRRGEELPERPLDLPH